MPHAPERQLSSTGAMTTLPLLHTPGSMPTPAAKKWTVFFANLAGHIWWVRSRRTHSAFTTWQGTFGNGQRTVTTTATPAFPSTGARTRPLRATPRRRTAEAIASELIAAARGCFQRGCCDRPPENAILPTSALTSWGSASLEHCHEIYETKTNLLFVSRALPCSQRFRQYSTHCRSQSARRHDFEGNLFRSSEARPRGVTAASEQPRPQIVGRCRHETCSGGNSHAHR